MNSKYTLPGLPLELKEKIIKKLYLYDLLALSETSKEFYELCTKPSLWSKKATGNNFLWGHDSARVLARLNMERYRNLIDVTISSRYGFTQPMSDWVELLTAIQTLPKLLSLSLEVDMTTVEPWLIADMISGIHCVHIEMSFGLDHAKQVAIIERLACPTAITRHLVLKDVNLHQTMICRSMLSALKLLWCLEVDDRCLNAAQLRVLTLVRSSTNLRCIRRDFDAQEKCRFHTRAREEVLAANFARAWAAAGLGN